VTSSLQPSVVSSLPFCSVQSSALEGSLVQLAQASQYCSSLLRTTVSTVATSTKVVTITSPTVQGTVTRYFNSTVGSTVTVAEIETESLIVSVTIQSTATRTSDLLDYVETTNIGATSLATITEFTTSTVTLDTQQLTSAAPTVDIFDRGIEVSEVLVPEVWSELSSAQLRQACDCILDDVSVNPTTVFSSTITQTQTTTAISSVEAESTSTNLVASLTTLTQTSTLRLNVTATVSTDISEYTVTRLRNTTYTIPSDSIATRTQHVTELITYTPIPVPTIALLRPTPMAGDVNGGSRYIDDEVFRVSLPVALTLYNQSSTNVMVSSNAVLGLGTIDSSLGYQQLPIGQFRGPTIMGLWTDLLVMPGTQQGIYYQVSGSAPSRQTTFEYYISHYRDHSAYYHFLIKFAEDKPNFVTLQYLDVSDQGASAVVGVQNNDCKLTSNAHVFCSLTNTYPVGQYLQFSYQQSIICPGMQITFDTTRGRGSYNDTTLGRNSYNIDTPGSCGR
jgi:hypothetical protein